MSQPAVPPLGASATAMDPLALLQQRLLSAEEETEALIEDMGALGVSRGQIVGSAEGMGSTLWSVSPLETQRVPGDHGLLWEDSLVSRVNRIESLLQILELTFFRMETDRKLDAPSAADVKRQQERAEERQASRWEAMELREQLQQAQRERDDARAQLWRLRDTVEAAAAAEMDAALAAEELKVVKLEMSRKLVEMREQTRHEAARSAQLLQRVEEMERVMEAERRQALLLEADRRALRAEVRTGRQQLEKEKERSRKVEERCRQLRDQTVTKDSPVSEFTTELKGERGRVGERPQGRGRESDLQVALMRQANLQLELNKLRGEHAQLLQSASVAQEAAAAQRELDERTIERLRVELSSAKNQEEAMRTNLRWSKNQNFPTMQRSRGQPLQHEPCGRGQELTALKTDSRLQARTEIRKHQAEVEKLQRLLTSTCSENNRALACAQKALDSAKEEKQRLVQSVERSVLTNSSLRRKLEQAREQHQASVALRDEELREAQRKIRDLCGELDAAKQQTAGGSSVKKPRRETSEVPNGRRSSFCQN